MDDSTSDVVVADITPDDFMADEQESPKTAPSTVKEEPKKEPSEEKPAADKEPEVAKPTETKETETDGGDESKKPTDETETEKPLGKAEVRKQELNTEIRDLVSQRNALKTEVEKANAEVYQVASESELTEKGMSPIEAKVEAMRQEREMEKFNAQVADAQLTIGHESNRVLQDFPIFNPDSADFDKELADEAATLLDANLIRDPNSNQIIGSNVSPYQLYKTLARASTVSSVKGQLQGQKDAETMLANADSASGASQPAKKTDPLTALWAEPL